MRDYHLDEDPKGLTNLQIMFALRDYPDEAKERGFDIELDRRIKEFLIGDID